MTSEPSHGARPDPAPRTEVVASAPCTDVVASALRTDVVASALRTWLRYIVPLTLLSALALAPVLAIALRWPLPIDQPAGLATLWLGWKLIALAAFCQLLLVGAASAATRAAPARPAQLAVLGQGFAQLVRAIVPCLAAAAAIAIAGLALVAPGVVMLVLLALTGASAARGVPASLVDSIAVVRRHWRAVALAVLAMLALDLAIGFVAQLSLVTVPVPRQPPAPQLAALRAFVRVIALALVVLSAIPATVLATIHRRATE